MPDAVAQFETVPSAGRGGPRPAGDGRLAFAGVALGVACLAAVLAGWAPLGFSIVTVFLFAGPHNWLEFRYFLSQMPARWGPLRRFFLTAIVGAFALTLLFAACSWVGRRQRWGREAWMTSSALWDSLLVLWIAALVYLRGRQSKRDWSWALPAGLALVALAWLVPQAWDVGLVYLHPLVALAFLERTLRRRKPRWLGAYYACLACLPVLLALLWWRLAGAPPLEGADALSMRITQHAGAGVVPGVSSHLLVSTHTFLEMLHYGVWLVAIPLAGLRGQPWRLASVPLARRSARWKAAVVAVIALGGLGVVALWGCFLADYPTTRDVYFTAAVLHVLAEVPFLLRTM